MGSRWLLIWKHCARSWWLYPLDGHTIRARESGAHVLDENFEEVDEHTMDPRSAATLAKPCVRGRIAESVRVGLVVTSTPTSTRNAQACISTVPAASLVTRVKA